MDMLNNEKYLKWGWTKYLSWTQMILKIVLISWEFLLSTNRLFVSYESPLAVSKFIRPMIVVLH